MTTATKSPEQFLENLEKEILTTIVKGNPKHFHEVLDKYQISGTANIIEQMELFHQEGYEKGVRVGSKIVIMYFLALSEETNKG